MVVQRTRRICSTCCALMELALPQEHRYFIKGYPALVVINERSFIGLSLIVIHKEICFNQIGEYNHKEKAELNCMRWYGS